MHIVLDARGITAHAAGVARYAISLVPRLVEQRPSWRWTVWRHTSNRASLGAHGARERYSGVEVDSLRNALWGGGLPFGDASLYHSLFQVVAGTIPPDVRTVVTAHDFIDMDAPHRVRRTTAEALALGGYASYAFRAAMRRADAVIAISRHTAERAAALTEAPIEIIEHGVEPRFFDAPPPPDEIVRWLRRGEQRYVVAVGNDKPYKNLETLVRAFAHLDARDTKLALVGPCDALRPLVTSLGATDRVAFIGFLGDEDLRRVLGHADLFVFPSLLEGFGMPPLEAMALGVPTIVSDIEPMRSVCSDAALRFEPTDVYALAELLRHVLDDSRVRDTMRVRGRRHAARFDWDEAAAATLAVYDALL